MTEPAHYTTQLAAGLGLIDETRLLLDVWSPGMARADLNASALEVGTFSSISARRLHNIVTECFAPRYLVDNGEPARRIKHLQATLSSSEFKQLLFLYTCRASQILADFVHVVYWDRYQGGYSSISINDARVFIERAMDDGKSAKHWSESTIDRGSSYLLGACADYDLLGPNLKDGRPITPPNLARKVITYLAYDLHFSGLGDNAVIRHPDWGLFGLHWEDVRNEFQRQARQGHMIVQTAGEVTHMSWRYQTVEEMLDVLVKT